MKYKIILVLSLGLLVGPLTAYANSDLSEQLANKIQPGQWKIVAKTKIDIQGTNMQMPPKTVKVKKCIKKKDIKKITTPSMKNMDCSMTKKDLSGDTFHFSLSCSGDQGELKVNGKTVFKSKTAYTTHAVMRGTMQNMPMTVTIDGTSTRIGECTGESKDTSSSGGQ